MGSQFNDYCQRVGAGWNRFWFTPCDTRLVCLLRILVGLSASWYLLSYSLHLSKWFGAGGLLPAETVHRLTGADGGGVYRWSYLYSLDSPGSLQLAHWIALAVVLAFTVGLWTRLTSVLSLIVVVAYVHRVPMVAGPWEPVLTMLLLYLCLAPSGARWSLDAWWQARQGAPPGRRDSIAANITQRLIQVHIVGFYLVMSLTKLAGETWWMGDAVWWIIARSESRVIDLTGLHESVLFVNLWTHAIVGFELAFGIFIWRPLARPILLLLALFMWTAMAFLTGLFGFCLVMLIASASFLPAHLVSGTNQNNS